MGNNAALKNRFFVHEKALCESSSVGDDTRVWAFAHVMEKAVVGERCNIGESVFVEGGVVIGNGCTIKNGVCLWDRVTLEDRVFVGPNAAFTNDFAPRSYIRERLHWRPTRIRTGATIGANATIVCGVTVGKYAFVGAGAVVTKDVPDHGMVVGNPGKIIGKACFCGLRLDKKDYCSFCELPLAKNSVEHVMSLKPAEE